MSMPSVDQTIDASGLECPMPVLLTKKALAKMEVAQVLHLIATDPAAELDIVAFVYKFEHLLIKRHLDNKTWIFSEIIGSTRKSLSHFIILHNDA
ncbi:MAG: sulfurtransferase TusA family protein [Mariprofundaceae bacterium]|nr:sulfurtransferase TusA family protein [Mariprofundaceae bacterium]